MFDRRSRLIARIAFAALISLDLLGVRSARAAGSRTWTLDADFDAGLIVNLHHDPPANDQLQLASPAVTYPNLWVAASGRGTAVRIDSRSGAILGEYRTAPAGRGLDPSRTTVDLEGNAWVANRGESENSWGSVVKIGLIVGGIRVDALGNPDPLGEYLAPGPTGFEVNRCVDRNPPFGLIRTSRGLGDLHAWPDVTDGAGGDPLPGDLRGPALVEDADDECILVYQRVHSIQARHLSVNRDGSIWVASHHEHEFDLLDRDTGEIRTWRVAACGGYGGLTDCNGVVWSAGREPGLLRFDPGPDLLSSADDILQCFDYENYGLAIDSDGYIWNTRYADTKIDKYYSDGRPAPRVAGFPKPTGGDDEPRGVAVRPEDGSVWIAGSGGDRVTRHDSNGDLLEVVRLPGSTPTGTAVDLDGNVWVTLWGANSAVRIKPDDGCGPLTRPCISVVDLVVDLGAGAEPYNYSDMTGRHALLVHAHGEWLVRHDSECRGADWRRIVWTSDEPATTALTVEARASDDPAFAGARFQRITNGAPLSGVSGQYLEVRVQFSGRYAGEFCGTEFLTPILYDLSVEGGDDLWIDCPADATRECCAVWDEMATAEACTSTPTVTADPPLPVTFCAPGTYEVTYTATAPPTPSVGCTTTVTVVDTTPPLLLGVPADVAVECDAVPPAAKPIATDPCDPDPRIDFTELRLDSTCPDRYRLIRTWTATDASGNSVTKSQTIDVDDTHPPDVSAWLEPLVAAPPRPPASASSNCSAASSRPFIVRCAATDLCDPAPTIEAHLHVRWHEVETKGGPCLERVLDVPIACGAAVVLHLIAAACPDRPTTDRPVPVVIGADGIPVVTGDAVVLVVVATDRCDNQATATFEATIPTSPPCARARPR